jgi:hypothetical protein
LFKKAVLDELRRRKSVAIQQLRCQLRPGTGKPLTSLEKIEVAVALQVIDGDPVTTGQGRNVTDG